MQSRQLRLLCLGVVFLLLGLGGGCRREVPPPPPPPPRPASSVSMAMKPTRIERGESAVIPFQLARRDESRPPARHGTGVVEAVILNNDLAL